MTCQQVDELTAAYALGALSPEQRAGFQAHLAGCREHEGTLEALRTAAGALSYAPEEIEPSSQLKARIMQAARDDLTPAQPRATAMPKLLQPRRQFSLLPWFTLRRAVAALSIAVVGLFGWNLVLQFSQPKEADAFVRYMGDEDTHAFVYYVDDVGVITVDGLDPLSSRQTYQAWAETKAGTMSLGTIDIAENGEGFVLLSQHVTTKQPVFITVEPAGGAAQPSGETVLSTEW